MKRLSSLVLILMLSSANIMAQSAPIKITLKDGYDWTQTYIVHSVYITSIEDNLVIKNILLNKGHCKVKWNKGLFPLKLKYSKQLEFPYSCNLIRIDVETNQGDWSVEY